MVGPASERFPTGLAWGVGLGLFGLVIASSGQSFIEQIGDSPTFEQALATLFPGIDMGTIGGFLQLVFVEFGLVLAGLAAAGLVGGWVSDERSGRMEMLLPTPVARSRWPLSGGIAVFAAIGVLVAVTAAGLAIGAASAGGEVWTPVARHGCDRPVRCRRWPAWAWRSAVSSGRPSPPRPSSPSRS